MNIFVNLVIVFFILTGSWSNTGNVSDFNGVSLHPLRNSDHGVANGEAGMLLFGLQICSRNRLESTLVGPNLDCSMDGFLEWAVGVAYRETSSLVGLSKPIIENRVKHINGFQEELQIGKS